MTYIGFWRRFAAFLIDGLILGAINYLISMLLGGGSSYSYTTGGGATNNPATTIASLVLSVAYYVFYQAKMGQTLGKKVMGIKVVDSAGKTPTIMTFFLREIIGKFVSGIILLIGYFMVIWDGKKQGLHDKIASTYVVKA